MKIDRVALKYYSRQPHVSMVIAGFQMLYKQGVIKELNVVNGEQEDIQADNRMIVEAVINSKTRIAYDVCDGYINYKEVNGLYASVVDYYFMRSYSEELNAKLFPNANIYPLGLNYYCTTHNNPFDKPNGIKNMVKTYAKKFLSKFNPQISVVFDSKEYEGNPTYEAGKTPKIMFNTRLWNPQGDVGEAKWERMHPERVHINNMRIDIIKKAREKYGKNFTGGIYNTKYARETAPQDIILPNSKTTKKGYLKKMRSYDICIGSEGLHGSIGWKTAEYVAACKAIVMERPKYFVPGFEEGKNYLGFSTTEECMKQLEYLCTHQEKIVEMQEANRVYYETYLRPDVQITNTLKTVFATNKIEEKKNETEQVFSNYPGV